ncbi:hypothetical protein Anapl_11445 [Anas platyrhynchos]|uniref:Uncharacterized protein n=1 Tax=Anas platyrhynchos TaxID=8839 RepID=R0L2S6_ANAPL|nr:hypothetical protein Anapl_11445 [Anas platyrhynchos]
MHSTAVHRLHESRTCPGHPRLRDRPPPRHRDPPAPLRLPGLRHLAVGRVEKENEMQKKPRETRKVPCTTSGAEAASSEKRPAGKSCPGATRSPVFKHCYSRDLTAEFGSRQHEYNAKSSLLPCRPTCGTTALSSNLCHQLTAPAGCGVHIRRAAGTRSGPDCGLQPWLTLPQHYPYSHYVGLPEMPQVLLALHTIKRAQRRVCISKESCWQHRLGWELVSQLPDTATDFGALLSRYLGRFDGCQVLVLIQRKIQYAKTIKVIKVIQAARASKEEADNQWKGLFKERHFHPLYVIVLRHGCFWHWSWREAQAERANPCTQLPLAGKQLHIMGIHTSLGTKTVLVTLQLILLLNNRTVYEPETWDQIEVEKHHTRAALQALLAAAAAVVKPCEPAQLAWTREGSGFKAGRKTPAVLQNRGQIPDSGYSTEEVLPE